MQEKSVRLDQWLVDNGHFTSRARARDAVLRGAVRIGGIAARKPGQQVGLEPEITIDDPAQAYVSRAALKLLHGLEIFGFDPAGRTALDIGASTGGFTQVLLERGAGRVIALDVGSGQMDAGLRADPRVTCLENINARALTSEVLQGQVPDFLVCDVSFISLKLALPPALALAAPGAAGIFLVKPQFEVGREGIGKGGLVRDPEMAEAVANDLRNWLDGQAGWRSCGMAPSPIEGGDGNREYLLAGRKA